MGSPYWIMLGCLAAAVLLTVALGVLTERRAFAHAKRVGPVLMWAVLLCLYGVCVGLVAGLLAHFLHLSDCVALAIAVPVACPVLVLLAWMTG